MESIINHISAILFLEREREREREREGGRERGRNASDFNLL
jgi:hypothetical protein